MTRGEPPESSGPGPVMDAESAAWVSALLGTGAAYDDAAERLHAMLLRAARSETGRRAGRLRIQGPEVEDLAHQAAADATMAVIRKVATFRGESRFTTWAYKFAVLEVSSAIGRHFWRDAPVPLDAEDWDRLPDRIGVPAAELAEAAELAAAVRASVDADLTPHQRRIFVAIVLNGVPLDVLTIELATNRNAVYKTLFDARRKIRASLVANGQLPGDPSAGDARRRPT